MKFLLVDDQQRCNFCVYWTGKRKEDEDFVYVDFDSAAWGICLCQEAVSCGKPTASCEGCANCNNIKTISRDINRFN